MTIDSYLKAVADSEDSEDFFNQIKAQEQREQGLMAEMIKAEEQKKAQEEFRVFFRSLPMQEQQRLFNENPAVIKDMLDPAEKYNIRKPTLEEYLEMPVHIQSQVYAKYPDYIRKLTER